MTRRRVVITGIGLATPIGHDLDAVSSALRTGRHGIKRKPEWAAITNLEARLAGVVEGVDLGRWPRQKVRSMGRVALLAADASEKAIADARLPEGTLGSRRVGLAYGSTQGSSTAFEEWSKQVFSENGFKGVASSAYLKFMSHTCAANLALFFGIKGRVMTTCSACVSASQAIGFAFEAVRSGAQDVMIAGGAEEMHFSHSGTFDVLFAASTRFNDDPDGAPRPFDTARDGLVVAEGAGTLVLESLDSARARGATIHGEILGFGTNCDGGHMTSPSSEGMRAAMELALEDAGLAPSAIDYINAHATATEIGDIAESIAVNELFGPNVPISSTKGHTGHTLGACGAIEAAFCVAMMRDRFLAPTRNLREPDARCAQLRHVYEPESATPRIVMSNNFAFGGINTSLVLAGVPNELEPS